MKGMKKWISLALSAGLMAGMPASEIVTAVNDGIGNTLQGIALLIGLVVY